MPKILVKIGTFQGKNVQVKVLRFVVVVVLFFLFNPYLTREIL